jgi:transposase
LYDVKPTHSSTTINTIAILTEDGIKAPYTYTTTLTASVFIRYLDTHVLPILTNEQTLIMDNHPVHHAKAVTAYLNENKINVIYTPSYSPELNPIEEAFSKIKNYIKKQKAWTVDKLKYVIKEAFCSITESDARGYFNHALQFSNL